MGVRFAKYQEIPITGTHHHGSCRSKKISSGIIRDLEDDGQVDREKSKLLLLLMRDLVVIRQ